MIETCNLLPFGYGHRIVSIPYKTGEARGHSLVEDLFYSSLRFMYF